ncbi:MAG: hypothetical protein JXO48_01450 [Deltaproteobacteria bacterium]|nr:hypothetical protein [Deltaproteobacteria bacterium]
MKQILKTMLIVLCVLLVGACGGLRYSQLAPDLENFHPTRIAVLPVDAGAYGEASGTADAILVQALIDTQWFATVVPVETVQTQIATNETFRDMLVDYLSKLDKVNYSDPVLSGKIGETLGVDAFLVVTVDFWNFTMEDDDKVAKVGFSLKLVESPTGRVVWKAGHHEVEDYWIVKPDLAEVAVELAEMIIKEMPH